MEENTKKETLEMTPEMKYIKWPKKGKVISDMFTVIVVTAIMTTLIAAGDELGLGLIKLISNIF